MTTLLILADDLTGALDTGVQIAQLQVNTQVRLYAGPDTLRSAEEAEVLVIDTESRHLPPERAAELVSGLVREAAAQGVPYLYKKTDSDSCGPGRRSPPAALRPGLAGKRPDHQGGHPLCGRRTGGPEQLCRRCARPHPQQPDRRNPDLHRTLPLSGGGGG